MRIRGSGRDTSGFGGGWSRSDSFRRKYCVGQKVRGILLKHIPDNMAWVEINGDRLLAQLEIPHPEGARLTFLIEQLAPHIVLKELTGRERGNSTNALEAAKTFDVARALFEARFIPLIQDTPPTVSTSAFFSLLAGSRELYAYYSDTVRCADELTALLGNNRGRFLYQPWLAPESRRQVTFVRQAPDTGLTEAVVEFDHPAMGLVRAEFLSKNDQATSKLRLQRITHGKTLEHYLATRKHPDLSLQADAPTIAKLPGSQHGGVIAEQLFKSPTARGRGKKNLQKW